MSKPNEFHIGIDGSIFSSTPRGHSLYAMRLCAELDDCLPHARFTVYSQVKKSFPAPSGRWQFRQGGWKHLSPVAWSKFVLGSMCVSDGIDVFWSPYSFLPKLPVSIGTLVTVHDFATKVSPQSFSPLHRIAHHIFAARDAKRADVVLTISEGTRRKIRAVFGRDAVIVSPGVDQAFERPSSQTADLVLSELGIDGPYLFNIATCEPRKNITLLVETFLKMKENGDLPLHRLVLAGGPGSCSAAVNKLIAKSDGAVLALGYVDRKVLSSLYSRADAFVFPSLYEGFGMPVREALACGARVVATDSLELREAGDESCIYIDPSEAGIACGILEAIGPSKLHVKTKSMPSWKMSAAILGQQIVRVAALNRKGK